MFDTNNICFDVFHLESFLKDYLFLFVQVLLIIFEAFCLGVNNLVFFLIFPFQVSYIHNDRLSAVIKYSTLKSLSTISLPLRIVIALYMMSDFSFIMLGFFSLVLFLSSLTLCANLFYSPFALFIDMLPFLISSIEHISFYLLKYHMFFIEHFIPINFFFHSFNSFYFIHNSLI